jgi:hypothetical protein
VTPSPKAAPSKVTRHSTVAGLDGRKAITSKQGVVRQRESRVTDYLVPKSQAASSKAKTRPHDMQRVDVTGSRDRIQNIPSATPYNQGRHEGTAPTGEANYQSGTMRPNHRANAPSAAPHNQYTRSIPASEESAYRDTVGPTHRANVKVQRVAQSTAPYNHSQYEDITPARGEASYHGAVDHDPRANVPMYGIHGAPTASQSNRYEDTTWSRGRPHQQTQHTGPTDQYLRASEESHARVLSPPVTSTVWRQARREQQRTQRHAFARSKENPFAKYEHDPNDSESILDALSHRATPPRQSPASSVIPPQGQRAMDMAYQRTFSHGANGSEMMRSGTNLSKRSGSVQRRRFYSQPPPQETSLLADKAVEQNAYSQSPQSTRSSHFGMHAQMQAPPAAYAPHSNTHSYAQAQSASPWDTPGPTFEEFHQHVEPFTGTNQMDLPHSQSMYGQPIMSHGLPPADFYATNQRVPVAYDGPHAQYVHPHNSQQRVESMQMNQSSQYFPSEYQASGSHPHPRDQGRFMETPTFAGYHPVRVEEGRQMQTSGMAGHGQVSSMPVAGRRVSTPGQIMNPRDENLAKFEEAFF